MTGRHGLDAAFVAAGGVFSAMPADCRIVEQRAPSATQVDASLVTVCIATFGDARWIETGQGALESVVTQDRSDVPFVWIHARSLHAARNTAVALVRTPFACFLDADDRLDPGFVSAMERASPALHIVRPMVSVNGGAPVLPRRRDLRITNYIHISARFDVELYRLIGGTRDWPVLEDWDVWTRFMLAGGEIGASDSAVLRINQDGPGRNSRSNALYRWRIQRSWGKLPVAFGGLHPDPLPRQLLAAARRRISSS